MGNKKTNQKSNSETKFWESYGSTDSSVYNVRDFRDVKFRELYGNDFSERNKRKFKKYLESEQGLKDWDKFDRQESNRYIVHADKAFTNASEKAKKDFQTLISKPTVKPIIPAAPAVNPESTPTQTQQPTETPTPTQTTTQTQAQVQPQLSEAERIAQENEQIVQNNTNNFVNNKHTREGYMAHDTVIIDGKEYKKMVTTGLRGLFPGQWNNGTGIENDRTYAIDPETGNVRAVYENWLGWTGKTSRWADNSEWIPMSEITKASENIQAKEKEMIQKRLPAASGSGNSGGISYDPMDYIGSDKKGGVLIKKHLKGGAMNRVKYFQQGGPAPQQDIQQQVIQLVQAAMSGDEKATQTVNQIMEAAKAGDQQAAQIAQMIQQVAQQMQGQATSAKWGTKLGYIRSLKFANGGKTCPACQQEAASRKAKAFTQPNKKVEEKACGGKAKKRYFGGWL